MRRWMLLALLLPGTLSGCSPRAEIMGNPVPFTGRVDLSGGHSFQNLVVAFQPMEMGHPQTLEIDANGSFNGELIPGRYMYFFLAAADRTRSSRTALNTVIEEYRRPDLERFVDIAPGEEIELHLP